MAALKYKRTREHILISTGTTAPLVLDTLDSIPLSFFSLLLRQHWSTDPANRSG